MGRGLRVWFFRARQRRPAASIEFLAVTIETPNTRAAYLRASGGSSPGAKAKGLEEFVVIEPIKASRPTQLS